MATIYLPRDSRTKAILAHADALVMFMVEFFQLPESVATARVQALLDEDPKNVWMHQDTYTLAGQLARIDDQKIEASYPKNRDRAESIWEEIRQREKLRR